MSAPICPPDAHQWGGPFVTLNLGTGELTQVRDCQCCPMQEVVTAPIPQVLE